MATLIGEGKMLKTRKASWIGLKGLCLLLSHALSMRHLIIIIFYFLLFFPRGFDRVYCVYVNELVYTKFSYS